MINIGLTFEHNPFSCEIKFNNILVKVYIYIYIKQPFINPERFFFLPIGIPILKIVFSHSPNLSSMTLPLLVYHPTQILLGSALVPFLQAWVKKSNPAGQLPATPPRSASPLKEEVP